MPYDPYIWVVRRQTVNHRNQDKTVNGTAASNDHSV